MPTIPENSHPAGTIRFGPFELNPRSRELRKHGLRVKIHDQPFQVLELLLRRPGELITREEIRQVLWPSGVFVDFENGLNSAVNRLRDVLADSAEQPRFIETVPRHGYRFIGAVSVVADRRPAKASSSPRSVSGESASPARSNASRRLLAAVALAALVFLSTFFWRPSHGASTTRQAPTTALSPIPLVTYSDGGQWLPAFSPDGSRVAYSWAAQDGWYLAVKSLGSDVRLRLTKIAASFPPGPAWSPDGRQIAFARAGVEDDRGIFIVPALGGPERKLHSLAVWRTPQRMVTWSPDGRSIAFSDQLVLDSGSPGAQRGPNAIFLISPDSLELTQLTFPATDSFGDSAPTYSPDGKSIAFVRTSAESKDDIFIIPAQGGTPRKFPVKGIWTNGMAWTADGNSLVFDRSVAGGFSLWTISLRGGDVRPLGLPKNRANLLEPALWRDRLAYESHEGVQTIGRVPLDDSKSDLPQTPVASTRNDRSGRYSPRGDRIAFISDRSGSDELWIADADGTYPSQITHFATPLCDVAWHPSGTSVAVSAGDGRIYLVTLDTGSSRLLFKSAPVTEEDAKTIGFSRDGRFLYVYSEPGTAITNDLFKVPIAGGPAEEVLSERLTNFAESDDGQTLFYSNDRGVWKRPVRGGPSQFLFNFSYWDVQSDGLCVLTNDSELVRYSFSGKRLNTLARLGHFQIRPPVSVSPDGRWALFGYQIHSSVEIDMVQGFK